MTTVHVPILVEAIANSLLEPFLTRKESQESYCLVDCTFGGGGHTSAFLKKFEESNLRHHKVIAVDQDAGAIARGQERFSKEIAEGRLELIHARFSEIEPHLKDRKVLGLMADLGFSSDQLESAERGLSFQSDGPLDMRLDPSRGQSCYQFLSQVSEPELIEVLQEYGEERFTKRIAHAIIQSRQKKCLPRTTRELSELIVQNVPPPARYGRIHAATRTFQALRIVVNEELEELDKLLEHVILSLCTGGRAAIISFHSLEDRRVKHAFKSSESFKAMTKKPIEADEEEVARNPRSRSAKLRIAEKI